MSEYRGVHLEHGPGWHTLVEPLIDFVLDNGGIVHQAKEKFGGLRFYYEVDETTLMGNDTDVDWVAFMHRVRDAEKQSVITCEVCGEPGEIDDTNGWWKTLCPEHAQERRAKAVP